MRQDGTDDGRDPAAEPDPARRDDAGTAPAPASGPTTEPVGTSAAGSSPEGPTEAELDAWSLERHRELEALVALDRQHEHEVQARRERELQVQRERDLLARRERARAALPPELRDADDDLDEVPRRTTFGRLRSVTALVALLAIVALAASAVL